MRPLMFAQSSKAQDRDLTFPQRVRDIADRNLHTKWNGGFSWLWTFTPDTTSHGVEGTFGAIRVSDLPVHNNRPKTKKREQKKYTPKQYLYGTYY